MLAIGMGSSAADGGNELISEKMPMDPDIMESAPNVLLLNILFWYLGT